MPRSKTPYVVLNPLYGNGTNELNALVDNINFQLNNMYGDLNSRINAGGWSFGVDASNNLTFSFNGTTVAQMDTTGEITKV